MLSNVRLNNVPTAVVSASGVLLAGGTTTITSWVLGNVYRGKNAAGTFTRGSTTAPSKAASLLDSAGRIVGRTHPQYANYAVSQFVSVKDLGAKGDGRTDDTAALQRVFDQVGAPPRSHWMRLITICTVVRLQDHLLRCWKLHRDFHSHNPGWNSDDR